MATLPNATNANPQTPYFALAGSTPAPISPFVQGMIIIYYGETAPDGWAICDGNSGTPDLRDRFVNGAGINFPYGQPGGASTASLVIQNIPDHIHSGVPQQGAGVANSSGGGYAVSGIPGGTAGIQAAGYTPPGGSPFGIMPPYLTLTYIMKL